MSRIIVIYAVRFIFDIWKCALAHSPSLYVCVYLLVRLDVAADATSF